MSHIKPYWAEVKNSYIDESEIENGIRLCVYIDAWETDRDEDAGEVIAKVILTNSGEIVVVYVNNVARIDKVAQEKIEEAKKLLEAETSFKE